ncbi:TetR family transcriptional regulator [Sphaerisporangium krabiense]|uniref:TetR/AcrR family transcriptional repressor of nem operon n=1 Tax=Sphaerisporangium krabiense TaxID=763782 RepID=A0A7W8Z2W6_9ACTN|nr:TetR/AcrR family transcriptional regulator [Sphaerisporangium krabiense]MBB5626390.1 TetR/AcrR family transcriptional repressor of nem operon [Sphaerisporangium krabiense]GII63308.1 TetR family transcriptional regulator [Sphaerisporangium krabiense]
MARTKEFDPDTALQAALELFWERGYEATSMADLVARLGIGRASLYATFGGKHELYMKALRRYIQTRAPSPIELVSQPGSPLPAVRALVELYAEQSCGARAGLGCLVVNAAAEMLPGDAEVSRFVEGNWTAIETALTSALIRARALGELPEGRDPVALARFLLVFMQGLRLVGKASPDPARLRDAAAQALSLLD